MSNNWFSQETYDTEKKWMYIRANEISAGESPCSMVTKTYIPNIGATNGSVSNQTASYTSDGIALYIRGQFDFTSETTPFSNFSFNSTLPPDVGPLFYLNGSVESNGYCVEKIFNQGTNGLSLDAVYGGGGVQVQINLNKIQSGIEAFHVTYQINCYRI